MFGLYINGKYVSAEKVYDLINPTNDEVIAKVADGQPEDMENAIEAAHIAFQSMKKMPAVERAEILYKAAKLLNEKKRSLRN